MMSMGDDDPRRQIACLEAEIEELTQVKEGCRKLILFSRLVIILALMWLLALMLGALSFDPIVLTGALAAVIGGTVIFGSNASTSKQTEIAITTAEARRAELIGRIDLRVVERNQGESDP